ncbi:MAG: ATP-binding protein, partial [Acidobacteriaceae bacterium]
MRRRSKRGPNTSESTGKIGQELPQNQPAPLQPSYHGGAARAGEDIEPETEGLTDEPEAGRAAEGQVAAVEAPAKPAGKPASAAPTQKLV